MLKNFSESDLKKIDGMNLFNDTLFTHVFKNQNTLIQMVLRIITGLEDLEVTEMVMQDRNENLLGHSVILDCKATDSKGRIYNIEVQKDARRGNPKRARYYMSMLDTHYLGKSKDYETLPETYVIFIMNNDYFNEGKPLYWFNRYERDTKKLFSDGANIIYVNGAYSGDDDLGKLMHDFNEPNPAKMKVKKLKETVKDVKTSETEVKNMLADLEIAMNEGINKGRVEGKAEGRTERQNEIVKTLFIKGYSVEQIASMIDVSVQEIKSYLNL